MVFPVLHLAFIIMLIIIYDDEDAKEKCTYVYFHSNFLATRVYGIVQMFVCQKKNVSACARKVNGFEKKNATTEIEHFRNICFSD